MFLKVFRCRTVCIGLLSITSIVFIALYYGAVRELSDLRNAKENVLDRKFLDTRQSFFNKPSDINYDTDLESSESNEVQEPFNYGACEPLKISDTTIKTVDVFKNFTFDAPWVKRRAGIWQDDFETRYKNLKNDHPLKVFILPHSHNDPGWLKSFTDYFTSSTKTILDLMVEKLIKYQEMKFIWTEISFLDLWWQQASSLQKNHFKKLVKDGRIEIMTGGWVMTDEANVHYFAMLDQLIEGHQWVKRNLDVSPKIGWSIDPFGQGSTVPHLLALSDLKGAIIQRIHYSWKEYLARHQYGDFYWQSMWESKQSSEYTLLTHNMPFDIYSTRHSCGPQPKVCDGFDFYRNIPKMDDAWLKKKVEDLIGQYGRTASLFPHNVALVLVGGDFTYSSKEEFDREYEGYEKLINYINSNSEKFNGATAQFGTPSDYFIEIHKRQGGKFPSVAGDFFPYSDIFSSGSPAYWTGYFTTRPFYKLMSRDLEHNLRSAEILFTITYNKALGQGQKFQNFMQLMEKGYAAIVEARENLGLFQHHDAITGTSKLAVMKNYLSRLQKSIKNVVDLQQESLSFLLNAEGNFLESNILRGGDLQMPSKKIVQITSEKNAKILLFNSLTQPRVEVISINVSNANVKVKDGNGNDVPYQVNPIILPNSPKALSNSQYEVIFIAKMRGMSLAVYTITYEQHDNFAQVFCSGCTSDGVFNPEQLGEEIEIKNSKINLIFDKTSGFLKTFKKGGKSVDVKVSFGAYKSIMRASGAYLFKTSNEIEGIIGNFSQVSIIVTKGSIASDVTVINGNLMTHKLRIYSTSSHLDEAISVTNEIDLQAFPKNLDIELFMRMSTSIKNGANSTEFFTDQNGFQWLPRRKVSSLNIEGNYYPITTSAFMQDKSTRLTLMTTHAQGAASFKEGVLEVMLDRRIRGDDGRGMGEGIMDSIPMQHNFYLTIESLNEVNVQKYQSPSLLAQHLTNALNYPVNVFSFNREVVHEANVELFSYQFPCDFHLVNLRTLTNNNQQSLPSNSSLMIVHRMGYDCQFDYQICERTNSFHSVQFIKDLKTKKAHRMALTGNNMRSTISSFDEKFEPMEIRTYQVTF